MLALAASVVLLTLLVAWRSMPASRSRVALTASVFGGAVVTVIAAAVVTPAPAPPPSSPALRDPGTYVSSGACKACHPSEYASWQASYHRTMTQRGDRQDVMAPAGAYDLLIRGERVRFDNLGATRTVRREGEGAARPVLLTTGSHHYQAYWLAGDRPGELEIAPFVWHREGGRFLPRHDVFLQPDDQADAEVRWNSNCLVCHATAAEPRHEEAGDRWDTTVVELGIACEACHGPGGHHVDAYADPLRRVLDDGERARHVINPATLSGGRGSQVCGQCHSYAYPRDEDDWWIAGFTRSYGPGDALDESRVLLTRSSLEEGRHVELSQAIESLYWGDGTIRVGGREWNGLSASACFLRAEGEDEIGCTSCHSMHASDPDDQLKDAARGDGACASCHEAQATRDHSRHGPEVLCYSCHMPRVSYALYRAQRSHRIDAPDVDAAIDHGRPPACNLCHVDEDLSWTDRELARGWGRAAHGEPPPGATRLGFALELALRGDAAQRVVIADHLLDAKEAQPAARPERRALHAAVLALLLEDPYAAVRFVAARRLVEAGELARERHEDIFDDDARTRLSRELVARIAPRLPPGVTLADLLALRAQRDDRRITIAE